MALNGSAQPGRSTSPAWRGVQPRREEKKQKHGNGRPASGNRFSLCFCSFFLFLHDWRARSASRVGRGGFAGV